MKIAERAYAVARMDQEVRGGRVDRVVRGLAHNHRPREAGRDGLGDKVVRFDHRSGYCGRCKGGTPVGVGVWWGHWKSPMRKTCGRVIQARDIRAVIEAGRAVRPNRASREIP